MSAAAPRADFFVAPNGNDSWSGRLAAPNSAKSDGPFASLAKAQSAVRELVKSHPGKTVNVMLREGTYYLPLSPTSPGTLHFTAGDSGAPNAQVTWENFPGETPVVSGGEPIGGGGLGLQWKHVSGSLWQVQLPANTQPFEYLFYNGERRLRSRIQSAAGVGYYMKGGACMSTQTKEAVDISNCNLGTFLRVAAEVPPGNTGCEYASKASKGSQNPTGIAGEDAAKNIILAKCNDRFQYNASDPIENWTNLAATYSGDPTHPCQAKAGGRYPAGDIELTIFEAWTVETMRVGCVDPASHIVYLTAATRKRGSNVYNFFGFTPGHRYVVENAREAFDAAAKAGQTGLWFLDRSTNPWTLNYLANRGENPNGDSVVIAQVGPVSTTGGSLIDAVETKYVTFRGVVFEVDNYTPALRGFYDDENGENTLPAAVDCESCEHVTFDNIVVRRTSASGIQIASAAGNSGPAATDDTIENSAFYDVGDCGVHIGHHPLGSDKAVHVVHSVTVRNNIVQGYARVFANGEGIAQGNGNDILYSHNDVNEGYHAGISLGVIGTPGENGSKIVTEYNHIWNVLEGITNDGGALYYNFNKGRGSRIYSNVIHDATDSSVIDPRSVHASGYGDTCCGNLPGYFDRRRGLAVQRDLQLHR